MIVLETIQIVSTPDVLGGKPHIAGRRISVQQIAEYHEHIGWPVEEIAEAFKLSLSEIYAALSYYHTHREEIDQTIRAQKAWADKVRAEQEKLFAPDDALDAVVTAAAVAAEYGVTDHAVRDAIRNGWIEARKSAGTWLIRRRDAEARWGKRRKVEDNAA